MTTQSLPQRQKYCHINVHRNDQMFLFVPQNLQTIHIAKSKPQAIPDEIKTSPCQGQVQIKIYRQ